MVSSTGRVISSQLRFKVPQKLNGARIAQTFLKISGNSNDQTIKDLDKDSTKLKQISIDYHMLLTKQLESPDAKPIQVACFHETLTVRRVG